MKKFILLFILISVSSLFGFDETDRHRQTSVNGDNIIDNIFIAEDGSESFKIYDGDNCNWLDIYDINGNLIDTYKLHINLPWLAISPKYKFKNDNNKEIWLIKIWFVGYIDSDVINVIFYRFENPIEYPEIYTKKYFTGMKKEK